MKTRGLSSKTREVSELSPRVFSDRWAFFSKDSAGRRVRGRFSGETSLCAEFRLCENRPAKGRRLCRTPRSVATVARAGVQMPTNAQIVCEKSSIFAPTSLKTSACLSLPRGASLFLPVWIPFFGECGGGPPFLRSAFASGAVRAPSHRGEAGRPQAPYLET